MSCGPHPWSSSAYAIFILSQDGPSAVGDLQAPGWECQIPFIYLLSPIYLFIYPLYVYFVVFVVVLFCLLLVFLRQSFTVALEPVLKLALIYQADLRLTESLLLPPSCWYEAMCHYCMAMIIIIVGVKYQFKLQDVWASLHWVGSESWIYSFVTQSSQSMYDWRAFWEGFSFLFRHVWEYTSWQRISVQSTLILVFQ